MIFKFLFSKKILLYSLLFLMASPLSAGIEENVLLERSFWRSKPSLSLVKTKIAEGNNPSELNSNAFDPVVYSIFEDASFELIKFLIQQKGNGVNKITHDGRSYIFWAAYKNNLDLVQYLIDKGTDTKLIDSHGNSILNFAAVSGVANTNLFDILIKHGAQANQELNSDGANSLQLLIPYLKNPSLIEYFVNHGVDLNSTDKDGNGIFNYAAKGGDFEIMNWLIDQKVPHQNLNDNGENALFFASRGFRRHSNSLGVFQYLMKMGLDPSVISKEGSSCLIEYCQRSSDLEIISFLIQNGNDVNQTNSEGNNVLIVASKRADLKTLEIIASFSKNLNSQNKKGETALTNAIAFNKSEIAHYLINSGSSIEIEDQKGNNMLYYWLKSYNAKDSVDFFQKQQILKKAGFNFSKAQANGSNLFHLAVLKLDLDLLNLATALNADINQINKEGNSPLHLAAMISKDETILLYLANHNADKNLETSMGESPYELATENEVLKAKNISLKFLLN